VATFSYTFKTNSPFSEEEISNIESGDTFPPVACYKPYHLQGGYVIDINVPVATKENDFLIDRQIQRSVNFTGIPGINDQDRSIQESMASADRMNFGSIVDRSKEHLGTSDLPVIALRRRMIRMAKDLQNGIEPAIANDPNLYQMRPFEDAYTTIETFSELVEANHNLNDSLLP
jgi:hypothetical protein